MGGYERFATPVQRRADDRDIVVKNRGSPVIKHSYVVLSPARVK